MTLTAAGSTDTGGSGLEGYQYRSEFDLSNVWSGATDGFQTTVSAEGLTIVQFRSVDNAGNTSAWEPFAAYPGNIVKIDRTAPGVPNVARRIAGMERGGVGDRDRERRRATARARSPPASPATRTARRRTAGSTWSNAASGASVPVTAQGTTLVQFRSVDAAGNVSAWTPATPDATDTVMLDRTAPTLPSVSGVPGVMHRRPGDADRLRRRPTPGRASTTTSRW